MSQLIYVKPGDTANFVVQYSEVNPTKRTALQSQWRHINQYDPATGKVWYIWYRPSYYKTQVTVDYMMPRTAPLGIYRVETFIPGRKATTRQALFAVASNFWMDGAAPRYDDRLTLVDMYDKYDEWVSLGDYLLDPASHMMSGRVRQYDLTMETPPTSITFGPVRWVPLFTSGGEDGEGEVHEHENEGEGTRFDFPLGTPEQRAAPIIDGRMFGTKPLWLDDWYDYTPFMKLYSLGYHTGADVNSTRGADADRNMPIYAAADGVVSWVGVGSGTWGNIILIEHQNALVTLPDGTSRRQRVFTRYGHVSGQVLVQKGQQVKRGDHIGFIGLMAGYTNNWHLHFDVGYSNIFENDQDHWPDTRRWLQLDRAGQQYSKEWNAELAKIKATILANYLDPFKFIKDNH